MGPENALFIFLLLLFLFVFFSIYGTDPSHFSSFDYFVHKQVYVQQFNS